MKTYFFTRIILPLVFVAAALAPAKAQVGIGTTTPSSSAVLDLSSASKGLLVPRMSSAQRNAIASPGNGLMVFDLDSSYFFYYTGSTWHGLKTSGGATATYWSRSGTQTSTSNSGDSIGIGKAPAYKLDVDGQVSASSYVIDGEVVLSSSATNNNLFTGAGAGLNSGGSNNSFIGASAGVSNSTGLSNTFTGSNAGVLNTTNSYNSYFGVYAGAYCNGANNSFMGYGAGENGIGYYNASLGTFAGNHVNGYGNMALGSYADFNGAFDYSTAIGYQAIVGQGQSIVLGATGSKQPNVGVGTTTPDYSALLDLTSTKQGMLMPRMTSVQRNAISSPAKGLMVFDNDSNYFFYYNSGWKGLKNMNATPNYWSRSGTKTSASNSNDSIGIGKTPAYKLDVNGSANASNYLIGGNNVLAANFNRSSIFVGIGTGNVSGTEAVIIGQYAGYNNTGNGNTFNGFYAGNSNSTGVRNSYFGNNAGYATNGSYNAFVGYLAGANNIGDNNSALGSQAGYHNNGTGNTAIGANTDYSTTLNYSTCIGFGSIVGQSKSIVLGATGTNQPNVGVGTSTPDYSAALDLTSISRGMLMPRMTSAQRIAISSPAKGLMVFDNDSGYMFFYNSGWKGVKSSVATTSYTAGTGLSLSGTTFSAQNAVANWNANKLSGTNIATTAPTSNQVLRYNSTTTSWEPAADGVVNYTAGTGLALTGTTFSAQNTVANWNANKLSGTSIATTAPTSNQVLRYNSTSTSWEPAADGVVTYTAGTGLALTGTTFSAQNTVASWNANKLSGTNIATTAPTSNQVLRYNSATTRWEPSPDGVVTYSAGNGLTLDGTTINSTWTQYGNDIYNNSPGYVGLGATAPQYPLDIYNNAADVARFANYTGGLGNRSSLAFATYGTATGVCARISAVDEYSYNSGLALSVNGSGISDGSTTTDAIYINHLANVGINTTTPKGTLDIKGSINVRLTNFNLSSTIGATDHICGVTTTSALTLTLPASATAGAGREYIIKAQTTSAPSITISPASGEKIDGSTSSKTITTTAGVLRLYSDGSNWWTY